MPNPLSLALMAASFPIASCASSSLVHQSAAAPSGPQSREISFKVPDLTLNGTYEVPAGGGKHPAVLLLPGSGPTDRNGNSPKMGVTTDLLKDIADALARKGVATLRFDKRAIGEYSAAWPKALDELNHFFAWHKFVDDAEAGLSYLRSQPEVDHARVGVLGHSEGALIALQIGSDMRGKPGAPKALVLLGATGRPMGPVIHDQIARLLKVQGAIPEISKQYLDYADAACAALAASKPLPPNTPAGLGPLFNPAALDIMGAYCRIDPATLAKQFPGPVLLINGAGDTQVSAERDTPLLTKAFQSRAGDSVETLIVPNASHNLKPITGGNADQMEGPVADGVWDRIVAFAIAKL